MIIVIICIVLVLAGLFGGVVAALSIDSRRKYGLSLTESDNFSQASLEIIKEYHSLPNENKPFDNIYEALRALDVKHEVAGVDEHFQMKIRDAPGGFTWDCRCFSGYSRSPCSFNEYREIRDAVAAIKSALNKQQRALAIAGVESGLNDVKELTARLRNEREIIDSVTNTISGKELV